jgi:hypothetical protein
MLDFKRMMENREATMKTFILEKNKTIMKLNVYLDI